MKDLSYFTLRSHLYPKEQNQKSTFKLEDLEKIWFCTKKNVKRKLKLLEEQDKLIYTPGRGRGNPSQLTFHLSFQEEVQSFAFDCIKNEQLEDLLQLLQLPIPKTWVANVSEEVRELFGIQATAEHKDVLRTVISRNLSTLDSVYSSITFESYMIKQFGDTLVTYDAKEDRIQPHLAHHWRVNEDSTIWIFYLRKGVRFHHQGILTSADVLYTFNRFTKETPYFWLVKDIFEIRCLDPYNIEFHLKNSNRFFLRYLSSPNLSILPKDVPFDDKQWIGTGPFQLKERNNKRLVLEAFDQYFLERPFLDRIEFWKIPLDTFKTVTYNIDSDCDMNTTIRKKDVEVGFRFLSFNFNRATVVHQPFFREAIYHILDVTKLQNDLGREEVVEATSFFPWKSKPVRKDVTRIERLISESGYSGETLQLYSLDFPKAIEEANWLRTEAAKYGIQLELNHFNLDDFYKFSFDDKADLLFMGEVSTLDYHLSFLGAFYNEVLIFRRFLKKEHLNQVEQWLTEFIQKSSHEDREVLIDSIEAYLRDNHLILFLHHPIKNRIFHSMIQDIHLESFGQVDFKRLWIEK